MARPRKSDQDDRYNEESLNHDLSHEGIQDQANGREDRLTAFDSARGTVASEFDTDMDTEDPVAELGMREEKGYFESMMDEESYDDGQS